MTVRLPIDHLARLVESSSVVPRAALLAAISSGGEDALEVSRAVRASSALPTYRVRLARWREEGIPMSVGLPEFVEALEAAADRDVLLMDYQDRSMHFVLLLATDLSRLLAAVKVDPAAAGRSTME